MIKRKNSIECPVLIPYSPYSPYIRFTFGCLLRKKRGRERESRNEREIKWDGHRVKVEGGCSDLCGIERKEKAGTCNNSAHALYGRIQFLSQVADNIPPLSERAVELKQAEHIASHFTTLASTCPTAIAPSLPQITPYNNIIHFQSSHELSQHLPWDRKRKPSKKWCLHSEWANQWCVCSIRSSGEKNSINK